MWQRGYETTRKHDSLKKFDAAARPFNLDFDGLPATTRVSNMMNDDLQWVSQPRLNLDGVIASTDEKFRIVVNTEGFEPPDIDVFTEGRKLRINAFRHEETGTGTQSTKRLERSYDIPSDADVKGMVVRFSEDRKMVVEFPIAKPTAAIYDSSYRSAPALDVRGRSTRSSYTTEQVRRFGGQPPIRGGTMTAPRVDLGGQLHRATLVNVQDDLKRPLKPQPPPSQINRSAAAAPLGTALVDEKFSSDPFLNNSSFSPRIVRDEHTGQDKVVMSLEVHGYEPGDFHVTVNNLKLCVEAKHTDEREDQSKRRYFQREVTLPVGTDVNHLKTLLIDGCQLEIEAPYTEPQLQSFSVPIQRQP